MVCRQSSLVVIRCGDQARRALALGEPALALLFADRGCESKSRAEHPLGVLATFRRLNRPGVGGRGAFPCTTTLMVERPADYIRAHQIRVAEGYTGRAPAPLGQSRVRPAPG